MKIHKGAMFQDLKTQVANGQLEKVLKTLIEDSKGDDLNTSIVLLNRLKRLSQASNLGVISWKEKYEQETSIVVSVLSLIDDLS
jgi:hypothetical protein